MILTAILHGLLAFAQQPHLNVADAAHLKVDRQTALDGGIQWLVENQAADGTWGSHHSPRPIEVLCDVPGSHQTFRVATTSLCVMALEQSGRQSKHVGAAISKGLDAILAQSDVKRPSGFEHYTVWALGYGLQALGEHLLKHPDDARAEQIRKVCRRMIKRLGVHQCLDGGWGYLSLDEVPTFQPSFTSMSFTTGTMLIGLARAKAAGLIVPELMVQRAVDSIARCETPAKAFTYGEIWRMNPLGSVNNIKGAACRGPGCMEAMALFGKSWSEDRWSGALNALLIDHTRFQIAGLRRPIPHESHYGVSGYFYLYGHYYASLAMQRLSSKERLRFEPALLKAVLLCRQPDGSFWDYPLYSYHKPYGTAFAVMALASITPQSKE
ncbi:MAG: terpene cyclase/mutase family protein [Planctomycetes bacterium]|nr:terpene cyclase/mutase family protein [Planctomycetota bacterium]